MQPEADEGQGEQWMPGHGMPPSWGGFVTAISRVAASFARAAPIGIRIYRPARARPSGQGAGRPQFRDLLGRKASVAQHRLGVRARRVRRRALRPACG